jgi:hypothetical protein
MGSSPRARAPSPPPKSQAQTNSEKRQEEEYQKTADDLKAKKAALKRKRRGRASLISGEETGISDKSGTLG